MHTHLRNITPADHAPIITVLDDWWGGRRMSAMLPKLFFTHFCNTSFVAENDDDGETAGFLVGFFSPAHADEAYIHFVGVNPAHRKNGVGHALYTRFSELMRANQRHVVRCVTSPANTTSIAFHTHMGFVPEQTDTLNETGTPYVADYDGPGEHRVLFSKTL